MSLWGLGNISPFFPIILIFELLSMSVFETLSPNGQSVNFAQEALGQLDLRSLSFISGRGKKGRKSPSGGISTKGISTTAFCVIWTRKKGGKHLLFLVLSRDGILTKVFYQHLKDIVTTQLDLLSIWTTLFFFSQSICK